MKLNYSNIFLQEILVTLFNVEALMMSLKKMLTIKRTFSLMTTDQDAYTTTLSLITKDKEANNDVVTDRLRQGC